MERYDYQAEPEDLGEDLGLQPDLPELEAKHLSTEKKPEQ